MRAPRTSAQTLPQRLLSRRSVALLALAAAGSLLVGVQHARAADAPPLSKFEPAVQVAGSKLVLNGAGMRHKSTARYYDVALYTASKVTTVEQLNALAGPKLLSFVAQRDISGTELGRLFVKGLNQNSPSELTQRHASDMVRMSDVFSARPKLVPGDTFAIEFNPGKGIVFYLDGKVQGSPVGDAEFFEMMLRIWLGNTPADEALKRALLGG